MEIDDQALPLTRRQLDIWLAQETGHPGTEWQLGLFARIEGTVKPDLLEQAISKALREAEPCRAAFFEADDRVFQRAIDYPDVELAFYDLSCSRHPVQEARDLRGPRQAANRVVVNFVPSRLTLSLAGAPATATYTTFGPVGQFGLFFLGSVGAGECVALLFSRSARAGVSQALLHYHFETEAKRFESTMENLAQTLFAAVTANLSHGKSVREGLAEAADLLYTLFTSNLDLVTFTVEFAAAANHNEFLCTAYISYRDTQRWQLANVLRDIAGERAPASLINETVHLIKTGVLGMSMQRPFISQTQLPGRLRRVYSHRHLTLHRPIGIGVIMTSNTQHSDRAANGRRRVGSTRRSQQANRIKRAYGTTG